jgi:hypothetical protein
MDLQLSHAAVAALFVLTTTLGAQWTWIVDASNGTGSHFTDLPQAVAHASDGHRIVVRKGDYRPPTFGKALQIIGEPGSRVPATNDNSVFSIIGLAAGKVAVVQGLEIHGHFLGSLPPYVGSLNVWDCAGVVVLADLTILSTSNHGGIRVKNSSAVLLGNSLVRPLLVVEKSRVAATSCRFRAYHLLTGPATYGIDAYDSFVELTDCSAFGTEGFGHVGSAPAVRMDRTALVLRGDGFSRYVGGTYNGQPQSPSIDGSSSSSLVVDPAVVLTPPPVRLTTTTIRRMPALAAAGGELGHRIDLDLYSPTGEWYGVFAALPSPPFSIPPFGDQWMDFASEFLLLVGVQGSSEHAKHPVPVPNDPSLRGLPLVFQSLGGSLAQASLTLSNPAPVVLH